LVFDVGANVGEKTDIMLSLGARVVAFEPQPRLAREVKARGGKNSPLTVVRAAVGAETGTAELVLASSSTGLASIRPEWDQKLAAGKIRVPLTTLDAEIGKYGKPVFCKIDVEGFESEVLNGLSVPLKFLSFEYHRNKEALERVTACVERLTALGKYEFNLTGTEEAALLLPQWLSRDAFLKAFPECAGPHFYGDVFTRTSQGL
jgi:FkbM family methyltransferase